MHFIKFKSLHRSTVVRNPEGGPCGFGQILYRRMGGGGGGNLGSQKI
jgi:hypothetical protein